MTLEECSNFEKWLWHKVRQYSSDIEHNKPYHEEDYAAKRLKFFQENREEAYKLWLDEREHCVFEDKQMDITKALETLKACGFDAKLANFDNCCITAKSKSGKNMTYYAGTGTIQGYGDTHIKGIDNFVRLLNEI